MGCRQSSNTQSPQVENKSSAKYRAKIDPRILQKYDIQGKSFDVWRSRETFYFSTYWTGCI